MGKCNERRATEPAPHGIFGAIWLRLRSVGPREEEAQAGSNRPLIGFSRSYKIPGRAPGVKRSEAADTAFVSPSQYLQASPLPVFLHKLPD